MIALIDYGIGNLRSVEKALTAVGAQVSLTSQAGEILWAEKVILPGVGAFGDGMQGLRKRGMVEAIEAVVEAGKPLLGICLGMQLLFEVSYELGVQVSAVELQDVTPPDPVAPAFNEVNEARQQKERLVNLAEKERNQIVPRARGEAAQTVSEAEAYETERVNVAIGEAARFEALLGEYAKAEEVTRQRLFLEMIDEVLPRVQSLYVVDDSTAGPLPLLDLGATGRSRERGEQEGGK